MPKQATIAEANPANDTLASADTLGTQGDDTPAGAEIAEANPANDTLASADTLGTQRDDTPAGADTLPTEAALRAAIAMVEGENNTYGRAALLETIRQAGGQVREVEPNFDGDQSPNGVTFLGIDVSLSQADMGQVLTVWCQKARRAILAGQVAPDAPVPSDAEV